MTARLVIFDVDGTLVDSQADILGAMTAAFASENLTLPSRADILSIVGLSLPQAFARLLPDTDAVLQNRLSDAYKHAYGDNRADHGIKGSPLFPGARAALDHLAGQPDTVLAVATGKSKRGLDGLIAAHGLQGMFHSLQVADNHPSKPHPSMILTALAEAGIPAHRAVMVGDTTYDMDMGRAAGVGTIGVSWGYHPAKGLDADRIIDVFADIHAAVDVLLDPQA
jgi:phosphoglycolate phosphatase